MLPPLTLDFLPPKSPLQNLNFRIGPHEFSSPTSPADFLPSQISRRDFEDVDVVSLSAAMNLFAKVLQWHRAIHLLALAPREARFHHDTPEKGDGVG